MSFSALAANAISEQCCSSECLNRKHSNNNRHSNAHIFPHVSCPLAVSQSHLAQLIEASSVLIRYIVQKLGTATNSETKLLLPALISMAVGRSQDLDMEQMILASILKNAKFPEKFADKSPSCSSASSGDKDGAKSEAKRSCADLSTVILQQLTTPLGAASVAHAWTPLSEEPVDCTVSVVLRSRRTICVRNETCE